MNRQMRRQNMQQAVRDFSRKHKGLDGTKPLVFKPGYVHDRCGGEVERGNAVTMFCTRCDVMVPSDEVSKR